MDLFEHYDQQPPELAKILEKYLDLGGEYIEVNSMLRECEAIGYTFDFGLDGVPINLRKI
jgi:hypothetical protein